MCWQRDAQSVQDLSYLMAWQSYGAAHELQTCQGTRVQCVCVSACVKDGWRWNADHAGTLVWQGWESWHKNIAHCNSGYHVPVLTKHGDPQQPTQLHWEHSKGFSISTIVLNYVWSVCQGRGGTDTANFSSFKKKQKKQLCFLTINRQISEVRTNSGDPRLRLVEESDICLSWRNKLSQSG